MQKKQRWIENRKWKWDEMGFQITKQQGSNSTQFSALLGKKTTH
jgi:hypothetical protein